MEEIQDLNRVIKALQRSRAKSANRYTTIIPNETLQSESEQVFKNLNNFAATRNHFVYKTLDTHQSDATKLQTVFQSLETPVLA